MGTLRFQLPKDLSPATVEELERTCVIGGQDCMPFLTDVSFKGDEMLVTRQDDESGSVAVAWPIEGAGTLMTATATLIERRQPYGLVLELARGKINQLRNQAADWVFGGLQASAELNSAIAGSARAFVRAVAAAPAEDSGPKAQTALRLAHSAAEQLVASYVRQVFEVRHQIQPALDTTLGIRLGSAVPSEQLGGALRESFNTICIPALWSQVEKAEGQFDFTATDQLLDWASAAGYRVIGGPLLDFFDGGLPTWLSAWERDLASINSFARDYVEGMVRRYKGRIRTWQLTASANSASVLGLGEEELLWLTVRLAEAARQVDPSVELVIGMSQPWGEYMAASSRGHSAFVFADNLIRLHANPAALDIELVMGVTPRGSYCRDILEVSRIIDLYSLLGVPLQVTLGIPSSTASDPKANSGMAVQAGRWRDGFTPEVQAEWAAEFGQLALCKPAVRGVTWIQLTDAEPHLFPWCGLVDSDGKPKPALKQLARLRGAHLR
jgi:hypothetical protein